MMKLLLRHKFIAVLAICLCLPLMARAQVVVTETQPLSFGTFSFVSFNSVLRINIRNNGSANPNGNTVIISPPTRGEYDLDAGIANANSVYTVTTPSTINLTGPGGNFVIDNFRVQPNSLVTDATGFDQFRIMARLRSLGGGTQYGNGEYNQNFNIVIAF